MALDGMGARKLLELEERDATEQQLQTYQANASALLRKRGRSQEEIDRFWGRNPTNNVALARAADEVAGQSVMGPNAGFVESALSGFQASATGLIARGRLPDHNLSPDAPLIQQIGHSLGAISGDIGFMIAGGIAAAPAGPIASGAAAFAAPAVIRQALMDAYLNGEIDEPGEFMDRLSSIILAGGSAAIVGAATSGAGLALRGLSGRVLPTVAQNTLKDRALFAAHRFAPGGQLPIIPGVAITGAELGAMVSTDAALRGELPSRNDFVVAAATIGGMKLTFRGVNLARVEGSRARDQGGLSYLKDTTARLRSVYVRTGFRPERVVEQAQRDPSIAQDIAASAPKRAVPRSLEVAATEVDPLLIRAAEAIGDSGIARVQSITRKLGISTKEGQILYDKLEEIGLIRRGNSGDPYTLAHDGKAAAADARAKLGVDREASEASVRSTENVPQEGTQAAKADTASVGSRTQDRIRKDIEILDRRQQELLGRKGGDSKLRRSQIEEINRSRVELQSDLLEAQTAQKARAAETVAEVKEVVTEVPARHPSEELAIEHVTTTGKVTIVDLAKRLNVTQKTAKELISVMEAEGIIGPKPLPGKKRAVLLSAEAAKNRKRPEAETADPAADEIVAKVTREIAKSEEVPEFGPGGLKATTDYFVAAEAEILQNRPRQPDSRPVPKNTSVESALERVRTAKADFEAARDAHIKNKNAQTSRARDAANKTYREAAAASRDAKREADATEAAAKVEPKTEAPTPEVKPSQAALITDLASKVSSANAELQVLLTRKQSPNRRRALEKKIREWDEQLTKLNLEPEAQTPKGATEPPLPPSEPPAAPPSFAGDPPPKPTPPETPKDPGAKRIWDLNRKHAKRTGALGASDRSWWNINDWFRDAVDKQGGLATTMTEAGLNPRDLPAIENPHKLARLHLGVQAKAGSFLEFGQRDFHTNEIVGPALRAILEPVRKARRATAFVDFIVQKRVIALEGRGKKTGFDVGEAKEVVTALRAEKFKNGKTFDEVAQELTAYQSNMLKFLSESGVLSKEAIALIESASKDYVPFYRLFTEDGLTAGGGSKSGALTLFNPVFKLAGDTRPIHDPIESIIKNTYLFTQLAERNRITQRVIKVMEGAPEGLAPVKQKPTSKHIALSAAERKKLLKRAVGKEELTEAEAKQVNAWAQEEFSIFRAEHLRPKGNQVVVYENGQKSVWTIDPRMAEALNTFDGFTSNMFVKLFSLPARTLRAGAILAPEFIARNPIRDTLVAFLQSDNGFIPVLDTMVGLGNVLGKTRLYKEWYTSGGPMAELVAMDQVGRFTEAKSLLGNTGVISRATNVLANPLEMLRYLSTLSEQGTRVGEFGRAVRKAPGKETLLELRGKIVGTARGRLGGEKFSEARDLPHRNETPPDLVLEGGFASRQVSVDFGRIGAQTQSINMVTAFWNAQVQGIERMYDTIKHHPVRTTMRAAVAITIPSILLRISNEGVEGYDQHSQYEKDLFWLFHTEGEDGRPDWHKIPKPFQWGVMYGSLFERFVDQVYAEEGKNAFDGFLIDLGKGFAPGMVPTFATPVIEAWADKSLFTDRNIIPRSRQGPFLPEFQWTSHTTPLTKAIGAAIAEIPGMRMSPLASPVLIDNTIRAWTGGLGTHAIKLGSQALEAAGILPDPVNPQDTASDIPLVRAFAVRYPSAGSRSIQDFYQGFDRVQARYKTLQVLSSEGESEAVTRLVRISGGHIANLQSFQVGLANMSKMIRIIDKMPARDGMEVEQLKIWKAQQIERLRFAQIDLAKGGNLVIDRLEEDR